MQESKAPQNDDFAGDKIDRLSMPSTLALLFVPLLLRPPTLVREFVQKGGTLLISQTWARQFGYAAGRELPHEAKFLTDEQMAEELAKRRGTIIDY